MKWIEVKVVFDCIDKELATDLISNIFYDLGLHGVVIEDPDIKEVEVRIDTAEIKTVNNAVTGYFPKNEYAKEKLEIIKEKLRWLKIKCGISSEYICSTIDEQDWAESWKEFFLPEKITKKIVVKPSWRDYDKNPDDIILEINPGMAFGTGTHPTTVLCISMIEKYLKKKDKFLDVGTGSGILMIAAAALGAQKVYGIDNDEVAVDIAKKNLLLNGIETKNFKVITGNLLDNVDEKFDFVAANILTETIILLLDSVKRVLKENGIFICSGIIEKNKDKVVEKMIASGFKIVKICTKEQWVSLAGILKQKICSK